MDRELVVHLSLHLIGASSAQGSPALAAMTIHYILAPCLVLPCAVTLAKVLADVRSHTFLGAGPAALAAVVIISFLYEALLDLGPGSGSRADPD